MFYSHLQRDGFPHLTKSDADHAVNDNDDFEPGVSLSDNVIQETDIQQDDYHLIMNHTHVEGESSLLLGSRESDLTHPWREEWQGYQFNTLLSWLIESKKTAVVRPPSLEFVDTASFSKSQRKVYDILYRHAFGNNFGHQLLMIVIGTAGTGKSFLINAIRQLFSSHDCSHRLRVTAPTGIAASSIQGCTIHSLLSLLVNDIKGERLHSMQLTLADVDFLIIDEYSFLSVAVIDSLDRRLRQVFPRKSDVPFGGLSILLCGDPAQLPPVRAQPAYAHTGSSEHLAARFHLFDKVVELDQPFRQMGDDPIQTHFRDVLARVANCEARESDWQWLQSRTPHCLTAAENFMFDNSKYIVSTNSVRNKINREKMTKLSAVMKIDDGDETVTCFDDCMLDGEGHDTNDLQLFAIGAEVMLTVNLWTDVGLVNGACGTVVDILKPDDNRKARIIMVNFPSYRGPSCSSQHPTTIPITQIRFKNTNGIPLTLAWAVTIHKSQGLSLQHVTVDLGDREFSSGLTFVALSRAKSFSGLRIFPFDYNRLKRITTGRYVQARREEFNRLRNLAAQTL